MVLSKVVDLFEATQALVKSKNEPRILFLSHRFPFPPIGGDRVKAYHLLRHLSRVASVDLISLDEAHTATIEPQGLEGLHSSTVVAFNRAKATARILASLGTSRPIEFAYYREPAMQMAVDRALAANRYDLIIAFFLRTAEYVTSWTKTPKLLIAEDARVILQERASRRFELSPQYAVRKIDAAKLKAYEPRIMASGFELVTFVAREDQSRILRADPSIPTAILSNGVDLKEWKFERAARAKEIVFAGHLAIYHNVMMVERLINRIFPKIKQAIPDVRLTIVGKEPSTKLRDLIGRTAGARLHANVPDVKPFVARAAVFVHPQSVGAGIQNKLLEAMALGTAVVTTPVGASGIEGIVDGTHALVRTTDEDLAIATIQLLQDAAGRSAMASEARALIESRYSWEHVYTKLDAIIEQLTGGTIGATEPRSSRVTAS